MIHRLAAALFLVALLGCSAPVESPRPTASSAVRQVSTDTIESAGLAMVTPPAGFEERAGISGRGASGELILTGPFFGERALIAVCDGGSGEIAYAPEGIVEFTTLLRCGGEYGGASRTLTLAAGYLVVLVEGDAAMRWHVAVAERVATPAVRP